MTFLSVVLMALATLAACGPTTAPAAVPAASQPDDADPTEELLARLEDAAEGLRDFQADITYYRWDSVLERQEIRTGEVIYQVRPGSDGSKRFAILLTSVIVGKRKRDQQKTYVFDGSWLVEIDHDNRMFIKRQIVPPDQDYDPLKLGEGPFPLPLGQPRQEVLSRFRAGLLDRPQDETLARYLPDESVEGLLLVPVPSTPQADQIAQVEIFYDSATLLPVGLSLTETSGDRKTILLRNLKRNEGIDEAKLSIEEPDPREWDIDVREWQD